MKTVEISSERSSIVTLPVRPLSSSKISQDHLQRLAIVYVRQSSHQQVMENRESTARQYALAEYAQLLGWAADRVIVIDEDQGQSGRHAENRSGFQRVLAEVTMEHVGIVLGLEMSRLARSSKDWHHLFELCGIFGTLLADQEGIYEANDPNDRLILGLKGIMSEMELQTMRNRLDRGRMNKAQRGEMFHGVPMGYVILPSGQVEFDPDEQARNVVRLMFSKFEELGSLYGVFHWLLRNDILMPMRIRTGAKKAQLDWRRPSIVTLSQLMRHPIYAGAYVYGRRPADPKHRHVPGKGHRPWVPMDQWKVLLKDRLPAYITWDQYTKNRKRIEQNRNGNESKGVPRKGSALLPGIIVCGNCGRHMQPSYHQHGVAQYACNRRYLEGTEPHCVGMAAKEIDELVAQQVLRAVEPAAVELSVKAQGDVENERKRLDTQWQQKRQRAKYDSDLAERRYTAVDPDNRLVAASLEKSWEESLLTLRQLDEDYMRFQRDKPLQLSDEERARIDEVASAIPVLWNAERTTNADRKQIIRCVVERVVIHVRCDTEFVDATIRWAGGYESQYEIIRAVATYAQLRDFDQLMSRVVELREAGHVAKEIADTLNAEGFYPPKRRGQFTSPVVYQLLKRRALVGSERDHNELLGGQEWWLTDLARELQMSHLKLRDWAKRKWIHSRKTPVQGRWVLWADDEEISRLRKLIDNSKRGKNNFTSEFTKPKPRP